MKICTQCCKVKDLFATRKVSPDGLSYKCKDCIKENNRNYYLLHSEYINKNVKNRYNKEKKKEYNKKYNILNREKINTKKREYHNLRARQDINYKLSCSLRDRLRKALKDSQRSGSAVRDLGCSIPDFKIWLEKQFQNGMTWNNYGKVWHIDHIIPLSKFDLADRNQLVKACHWFNLRPLWARENILRNFNEV